jgi:PKD repeat protein
LKPRFAPFALVLAVAALLSVPMGASAVHWPNFGGDAGRSSLQPVDPPTTPITPKYRVNDTRIQTSIITSAGGLPTVQRMIYGTIVAGGVNAQDFQCRLHIQVLATGAAVGGESGVDLCPDNEPTGQDAFGTRSADNSVTPVESSTASALGQVFVIHNDQNSPAVQETGSGTITDPTCTASTNDIAIAQVDETDGTLVKDVAVGRPTYVDEGPPNNGTCSDANAGVTQMTDGYKIESSPLITPADANGARDIFFLARHTGGNVRLFKVHVSQAASKTTSLSFAFTNVPGANHLASPSLGYFRDPQRGGVPAQYVIVPSMNDVSGGLQTFRTNDFTPGPVLPDDASLTGVPQTPTVPVAANGSLPGQLNSGSEVTSSIYLAYETADGKTIVRRFQQISDNTALTRVGETATPDDATGAELDSDPLAGKPSEAMALKQTVNGNVADAGGRLVVSTDKDLFILNADSLAVVDEYRDNDEGEEDLLTNGFLRTSPAVAGDLIYINQANGFPLVLRLENGERLCFAGDPRPECDTNEFTESPDNSQSTFAIGQASISRNFIQFASNRGAFVYEAVDPTNEDATVNITTPDGTKLRGNAAESTVTAKASDTDGGIIKVDFFLSPGCAAGDTKPAESKIGTDTTPSNGDEYSVTFDTTQCAEGEHTLRAVADSGNSPDAEDSIVVEIDNLADPTASFTVAPDNEEPSGTEFTFDASGSAPNGQGQTIAKYEWDWEGDGTYDFTAEGDGGKIVKHTYAAPGVHNPTLRVTQTNGEDDTVSQTVTTTNRPPVASFAANPNPAQTGQLVTFDATASQDPDGQIATYDWDFDGDGAVDQTTTGPKTTFTYPSPGKRSVTLKVTDASGATSSVSRDVEVAGPNVPPTASFAASPNPATTDARVVFDGSASGDPDGSIVKYEWDLDGNGAFETDSGSNPRAERSYAAAGVYNVKLRVTDNSGGQTDTLRQLTVTAKPNVITRVTPRSLSARTTPSRDRSLPYVFKTSGRLSLPSGVARVDGCNGRVRVTFKVGQKTISARTTALKSSCAYNTSVTFRDRKRIGKATRLRAIVRFQGNTRLNPKSARTRTVRVG